MGVLLDSWPLELLVVTGGLFLAIYWYLTSTFDYWKLKGVPYLEPTPLLGNMKDPFLMRRCQHEVLNDIYQKFEGNRYCGLFQFKQPELMVRNPELVDSVINPHNKFREFGRKMVSLSLLQMLGSFLLFFIPYLGRILKVKIIDGESADFFKKVVMDAIEYRQKNNIKGNDFLQLIMELKEKGKVEFEKDLSKEDSYLKNHLTEYSNNTKEDSLEFTDDLLLAQCLIFFTAGFETSSSTMSFCLHELAVNPDIQQKLRKEIDKVLEDHGGELTYDAVQSMTYLGMVVDETLRKYPVIVFLNRECTSDYPVPDSNLVLKRGTTVMIPVYSLHHDPKFFPDPDRFDPERFTEQNKRTRPHYCYLPFGEGPRICIGMRFGLLQTKAGLASLLSKYEFTLSGKSEVPLSTGLGTGTGLGQTSAAGLPSLTVLEYPVPEDEGYSVHASENGPPAVTSCGECRSPVVTHSPVAGGNPRRG
ncbi:unnamed protein product, partial [Timema podura]|nr:unnamed protein product [Timema podura]